MEIHLIPLLEIQRNLQGMRRDKARFKSYLGSLLTPDGNNCALAPLVLFNPMGREHVTAVLDQLIEMGAESILAKVVEDTAGSIQREGAQFRAGCVVIDDLKGGWTNRWATDLYLRQIPDPTMLNSKQLDRFWVTIPIWSSEPTHVESVRFAGIVATRRLLHVLKHGAAKNLGELMGQEGAIRLGMEGIFPKYTQADLLVYREFLQPLAQSEDMPTILSCLYGDTAGESLGFAPMGLPPMAGLSVAVWQAGLGS